MLFVCNTEVSWRVKLAPWKQISTIALIDQWEYESLNKGTLQCFASSLVPRPSSRAVDPYFFRGAGPGEEGLGTRLLCKLVVHVQS